MSDQTPEERAALVTWHLSHGDAFKTAEVCRMTGLTRQGAYRLMCKVSRVVPIFQDEKGLWQVLFAQEATSVVD
ncbi:MAG TPA: hypothetical protein DIW61_06830 [Candidatus Aminicenantes bacterium]|nr:hypothetical protein [Candidatus Aminicenantes bacterium]